MKLDDFPSKWGGDLSSPEATMKGLHDWDQRISSTLRTQFSPVRLRSENALLKGVPDVAKYCCTREDTFYGFKEHCII